MFELQDIRQRYESELVLELPRFAGADCVRWLVLGPSGCGKTTLLHLMAGLLRPTAGSVAIAGRGLAELSGPALDRFRGRTIGIVFQQLHLVSTLTVAENLLLANYLAGQPRDRGRVRDVLSAIGIADKERAYPEQLSYGQQQRTAIARAVINRPKLILADEPTSGLDDDHAATVLELLVDQAAAHEATLVVATHDRRIADRFDDRLVLGATSGAAEVGP